MSVFDRMLGRAKRAPKLSKSAIEHDRIDEYVLDDLRAGSRRFDDAVADPFLIPDERGERVSYEHSEQLKSDLFYGLHTTRPDVRAKAADDIRPSAELNRQILSHLLPNEDFQRTRAMTRADKIQSGIALRAMENELERALREDMSEHADRSNQMDQKEQALDSVEQLLEQLRQQARDAREQGQPLPDAVTDEIKQAVRDKRATQQALAQLTEAQEQAGAQISATVATAVGQATEKAADAAQAYAELAGLDSEAHARIAPDDAFALAELWAQHPELRDLARRVGRFKRDFRSKVARKVVGGREERIGIEQGNDLTRVLASELARSGHPILKPLFLQDYIGRQLLQFETQGEEFAGLGPCVIALDLSSSMRTKQRHVYAKAVTLATLANVHRSRRTVGVVTFNASVTGRWLFPKRRPLDLHAVTEFATKEPAGGTSTYPAMTWAEQVIGAEPEFARADVVLITDGEDASSRMAELRQKNEALRARLTTAGVRVFGVTVGIGPTAYTNLMCDDQVSVHQMLDPSPATDRLAQAIAA